ncbi:ABC transporter substrate-binding protein [Synoicihabitans lomoniglobus]|uniref:ABC transporter substrate-binding protein n=1 Tax=Synoicihabitans lomoniglobus TaxID=2909285 RepID=A0AAF0CR97_9BACT|nr:ABC transporter substrate-binding protein [Opitutaceae bacterium LMO-M01]WED66608.1 ABC transporter substrate-binding protein [Opitutaceae bacterium LMO-M01]
MNRTRICFPLLASLLLIGFGCSRSSPPDAAAGDSPQRLPMVVQLDWIAEPEHGGFYQAKAKGWFAEAGLDVRIDQGGANAFAMQKLAGGQAQVAQADSTNVILAIAEGLPVVNIGAVFQNDPSVLMLHADNPITSFEQLDGTTIMARPEWAFLPYLRKKYGIDFNIIPQNFQVANFIADQNFIQQGFYIAEPFYIEQGGAQKPKFLYAWDAGFDAYTVIVANKNWAAAHPEQMQAFMAAYIRGWEDYLFGDPTPAHDLMKQVNPKNSDAFLAYSRQMIIDEKLVVGRVDGGPDQIGRVSLPRFQTQIEQLESLGILRPAGKVTTDQVVSTRYLP